MEVIAPSEAVDPSAPVGPSEAITPETAGPGTIHEPPAGGFKTFVIVWLTQSVSAVGSNLTYFAIIVWLTQTLYVSPAQQARLAFAVTAVSLASAVPVVFGGPIAGAVADRHDRRKIMLAADTLSGLVSLTLAAVLAAGRLNLGLLLTGCVAASLLQCFHAAAFNASPVMLVPRRDLPRANGMMQTTWALAGLLGPALAAAIIALPGVLRRTALGPGSTGGVAGTAAARHLSTLLGRLPDGAPLAVGLDALTFFLAAATLLFVFIPSPRRTDLSPAEALRVRHESEPPGRTPDVRPSRRPGLRRSRRRGHAKSLWLDVREGALYIWRRRPLLWLLAVFAVINLATAPVTVTLPLLVKFRLAADWKARGYSYETALALVNTVLALGGVAGGVLVSLWGGLRRRRVWGILAPIVPAGLALTVFGLSTSLYTAAASVFLFAAVGPVANAHSEAVWQTQTPPELQGRVFSVRRLLAQFTYPVGTALAGPLVAAAGAAAVTVVSGLVQAGFCAGQVFNRYLLKVEDKNYLEELAAAAATAAAGPAGPAGSGGLTTDSGR